MKIPTPQFLEQRKAIILSDLKMKVEAEDWHGVADAAMDLREIEAQRIVIGSGQVSLHTIATYDTAVDCVHEWQWNGLLQCYHCDKCHLLRHGTKTEQPVL